VSVVLVDVESFPALNGDVAEILSAPACACWTILSVGAVTSGFGLLIESGASGGDETIAMNLLFEIYV
jgi:hypothetical protein